MPSELEPETAQDKRVTAPAIIKTDLEVSVGLIVAVMCVSYTAVG